MQYLYYGWANTYLLNDNVLACDENARADERLCHVWIRWLPRIFLIVCRNRFLWSEKERTERAVWKKFNMRRDRITEEKLQAPVAMCATLAHASICNTIECTRIYAQWSRIKWNVFAAYSSRICVTRNNISVMEVRSTLAEGRDEAR